MAICTLEAHVSRALDFYNKNSIYFAFGKTSKWGEDDVVNFDPNEDYDLNPPIPKNTDKMKEVIGYKKIEFKSLVVQDDNGSLTYRDTKWRIVKPEEAVDEGSRWVFLSAGLAYNELPADLPYRQIGVYTGLKTKDEISEAIYSLLPNQVEDPGLLEVIDFRKPVYRDTDVRERIQLILEF